MKTLILTLFISSLSALALADDTEIYGTAGTDSERHGQPNVLFIVDTSGSMQGSVSSEVHVPYDSDTNYSGAGNDILENPNYNPSWGWRSWVFHSTCSSYLTTLNDVGYVDVNAYQIRNNEQRELLTSSNNTIYCFEHNSENGYAYRLYSGNYAAWHKNSSNVTITSTRMQVIQSVITSLTNNLADVNLGLMRFNSGNGGKLDVNVTDIDVSGPLIRQKISEYNAAGGTPLTESLHEAARYFRGESKGSGQSGTYTSPITKQCQKNHVILFTDGAPTSDTGSNSGIQDLIEDIDLTGVTPELNKECTGDGDCLDELAYWMRNTQHSDLEGEHYITTHTIGGFGLSAAEDILGSTAAHGQGGFYEADDAPGITAVVTEIFEDILTTDTTFTAPAVSVNAFNASEHRDDLFYALFRPQDGIKWGGNLKKFKLSQGGVVMHAGGQTLNIGQAEAIDTTTGYFVPSSYDYWNGTDIPDGTNVVNGGFGNKVVAENRTIYSNNSDDDLEALASVASYSSFGMTADTDTAFTDTDVYKWVLGHESASDATNRYEIGDPLHSEPVIVTYGGSDEEPDSTIYFGTNEGFIHAVNTETGEEQFAFLPEELHEIQPSYYANTIAAANKPYGMDGAITTWFRDTNDDNILLNEDDSIQTDEHVYLYAGMRRGGRSYYALDVSDRNNPELLFRITGGETTGFDRLGQTWSKMTVTRVLWKGTSKYVLFFTGGYDTNQDSNANDTREDDTVGNAIYMVDATTGALLWSASKDNADYNLSEMRNSIPASISAVDITGDGNVNYFFAADTGGRIFRFDINQGNSDAASFISGAGVIAQVGDGSEAGNRRFYNKPNISLVKDATYGDHLTIAIGSGYRAHPLDDTPDERFYVIKDFDPYSKPYSYIKKTEAATTKTTLADKEEPSKNKIYNATSSMSLTDADDLTNDMKNILKKGGGWYMTLDSEEKVLTESLTFSGAIMFSTFLSRNGTDNLCGANTGSSKLYVLDQQYGVASIDLDGDGSKEASATLQHSGIAPRPVVIYREGGGKTIAIGTETIDDERFEESTITCEDDGSCPTDNITSQCEAGSCYVTPVYWRQNDNE